MYKKALLICVILVSMFLFGCTGPSKDELTITISKLEADNEVLKNENLAFVEEIEELKVANVDLKEDIENLEDAINILKTNLNKANEKNKTIEKETKVKQTDVTIEIVDKVNYPEDWLAGRAFPYVQIKAKLTNNTDKDIKGFEGFTAAFDMFGNEIVTSQFNHTGKIIPAKSSITIDKGMDIYEFKDGHSKFYNERFEDITFETGVFTIIFADGTKKTL